MELRRARNALTHARASMVCRMRRFAAIPRGLTCHTRVPLPLLASSQFAALGPNRWLSSSLSFTPHHRGLVLFAAPSFPHRESVIRADYLTPRHICTFCRGTFVFRADDVSLPVCKKSRGVLHEFWWELCFVLRWNWGVSRNGVFF